MTINDIIGLPEKFDGIDKKFEEVDKRFDDLAAATQREFGAVRTEMAESESKILGAIEKIDLHLSSYASQWHDDFAGLRDWVVEIDGRVRVLEKGKHS